MVSFIRVVRCQQHITKGLHVIDSFAAMAIKHYPYIIFRPGLSGELIADTTFV